MKNMYKREKMDIGLVPQALNNTNVTGNYYRMNMDRKALFILICGAMAASKTTKLELIQAKDAAGTGAKGIPSDADQKAAATVTANTNVTEATLTLATVTAGQAITINGLTFTAHADTTTKASRQFAISGDDTADAAALASCINDAQYGVPGVVASAAAGVITLKSTNGEVTISVTDIPATITAATTQAIAYVELDTASLDTNNGFEYVAAKVTTTANTVVAVTLLRGDSRFEPVQAVGASAVV